MMKFLDRPSIPSLMWLLICLVFLVVGAYAALADHPVPHRLEIRPDPDFHPLPVPAPVGPTPPDAELIASAR